MKEKDPSHISWKQMFMFTRNGSVQNADLLYSFFLGVGILFVDFIISNRLTMLFELLFPESSRALKNVLGILVPSVFCALIAGLLFRFIKKKKIVLTAYWITLVTAAVSAVVLLVMLDRGTLAVLFPAFAGIFLIPTLAAAVTVTLQYCRWSAQHPDPIREEAKELENRS